MSAAWRWFRAAGASAWLGVPPAPAGPSRSGGGQRALASGSIANGWFFTETGGGGGKGFAVTNDNGIPFWTFFQQQGGVQQLGFPVSRRWAEGPFTLQAFQKSILQWQPGPACFFSTPTTG